MDHDLDLNALRTAYNAETSAIRQELAAKPACSLCGKPIGTCLYEWRWEPGAEYVPVGDDRQTIMDLIGDPDNE